jgi:hypothetical protein
MKWNVDRLIDRYYGGEAEQIFKDGGIADPNRVQVRPRFLIPSSEATLPSDGIPLFQLCHQICKIYRSQVFRVFAFAFALLTLTFPRSPIPPHSLFLLVPGHLITFGRISISFYEWLSRQDVDLCFSRFAG